MTELSPDALKLIEQTRHQGAPAPGDKARVRAAIEAAITSTPGAPGPSRSSPGFSKIALKKAGLVLGIVTSIFIGVLLTQEPGQDPESPTLKTDFPLAKAPLSEKTTPDQEALMPVRDQSPLRETGVETGHHIATEETGVTRAAQKNRRVKRHKTNRRKEQEIATRSESMEEELRLLGAAQKARKHGDYQKAISHLEEHRTTFPRGALSAEREAASALTLCDAKMRKKAERVAKRFLRRYPQSPLGHSVRQSCAFAEANKNENSPTD